MRNERRGRHGSHGRRQLPQEVTGGWVKEINFGKNSKDRKIMSHSGSSSDGGNLLRRSTAAAAIAAAKSRRRREEFAR